MGEKINWMLGLGAVFVVVVGVLVPSFPSLDCQMTCLERDVNKLRADIWDLNFIKYQICSKITDTGNCSEPYSVIVDNVDKQCTLSLQLTKTKTQYFKLIYHTLEKINKFQNLKKGDVFIELNVNVDYKSKNGYNKRENYIFEHRHTRFKYYDLLDFNIMPYHQLQIHATISSKSPLLRKYRPSLFTLCFIELNYKTIGGDSIVDTSTTSIVNSTDLIQVVSIGTDIFVQKNVILTKGSKIYSWLSTLVCLWLFFVILYFVTKMLIAMHGFSGTFTDCSLGRKDGKKLKLTRPDVICIDNCNLDLFTSYFYSVLRGEHVFLRAFTFIILFVVWFNSIISYLILQEFNIVSKNFILCLLVICSLSILLLFPFAVILLVCFSLTMFVPELLINIPPLGYVHLYQLYIFLLLTGTCFIFMISIYRKDLLFRQDLVHTFLWLSWPVEILVFLTEIRCPKKALNGLRIFIFSILLISGLIVIQVSKNEPLEPTGNDGKRARILLAMAFWIFCPIYYGLIIVRRSYKRVISIAIEAVCTALFVAYLMNFLLLWLYPLLKLMGSKENLYLYIMLVLHMIAYLFKIYREWYTAYDKFLKDVLSHVKDKYKCVENKARMESKDNSFALIHSHLDKDNTACCQYPKLSDGKIINGKFKIKGLMLLTKGSFVYAPSDFFFEIIKLPGAPGPIKTVIINEVCTLVFLRLFPAVLIYWLVYVMYFIDFDKYDTVLKIIIGSAFITQYKELFFYRKISIVDVKSSIAFQRRLQKFVENYESWFFVCNQ